MYIYLSRKQKISVVFLVLLGFFVFFFWYISLKHDLNLSLVHSLNMNKSKTNVEKFSTCNDGTCDAGNVQIKMQDTDGDGLSDYDELNVYSTFPYISDSDGDGINDGDEVKNGTDPRCPEGKNCEKESALKNEDGLVDDNKSLNIVNNFDFDSVKITEQMAKSSEMNKIMSGNASISEIRAMLKDAGVKENVINSLSDEVLLQGYKNVLKNNNEAKKQ